MNKRTENDMRALLPALLAGATSEYGFCPDHSKGLVPNHIPYCINGAGPHIQTMSSYYCQACGEDLR